MVGLLRRFSHASSLKNWNREEFGKIKDKKREALQRLNTWEKEEIVRPLLPLELANMMEVVEDFKRWALLEETF